MLNESRIDLGYSDDYSDRKYPNHYMDKTIKFIRSIVNRVQENLENRIMIETNFYYPIPQRTTQEPMKVGNNLPCLLIHIPNNDDNYDNEIDFLNKLARVIESERVHYLLDKYFVSKSKFCRIRKNIQRIILVEAKEPVYIPFKDLCEHKVKLGLTDVFGKAYLEDNQLHYKYNFGGNDDSAFAYLFRLFYSVEKSLGENDYMYNLYRKTSIMSYDKVYKEDDSIDSKIDLIDKYVGWARVKNFIPRKRNTQLKKALGEELKNLSNYYDAISLIQDKNQLQILTSDINELFSFIYPNYLENQNKAIDYVSNIFSLDVERLGDSILDFIIKPSLVASHQYTISKVSIDNLVMDYVKEHKDQVLRYLQNFGGVVNTRDISLVEEKAISTIQKVLSESKQS
jgi:hypothetical protein